MIEILLVFMALAGTIAAGAWDLKTTEVPDEIPALMVTLGGFLVFLQSVILGMLNKNVFKLFTEKLKEKYRYIALAVAGTFIAFTAIFSLKSGSFLEPSLIMTSIVLLLSLFYVYAKTIEKYVFRKKIPVSKLKEGDVVEGMIWRGITKEEIAKIRKQKKSVIIKEGVRFVPVFAIALILTLMYGNIMMLIMGL